MLKKILLSLLLIVIIGGLIAVIAINVQKTEEDTSGKLQVVVSNFASYDFVRAIIGETENVDVNFIIGPGKDSHTYEPSPQDMIDMQNSDMFVYIGGELEIWTDPIVDTFENPNQKVIKISENIDILDQPEIEGATEVEHNHDHEEETHDHEEETHDHEEETHDHEEETHDHEEEAHDHEEDIHTEFNFDSHIWTSPENAIIMINHLKDELCVLDPENAEKYKENAEKYIIDINNIDTQIKDIINNSKRNELIFADKMPMQYFMEYYDLEVSAVYQGCSTEVEPETKTITYLVDKLKTEQIPVLLYTELGSDKIANVIIEEAKTDTKAVQIQTLHNVSKDYFEQGETWVSLMQKNIEVLKEALQ